MAELCRLLDTARILTLTGSGGVGKTRLAIQTAAAVRERFPEGVCLVQLAPLSDPAMVLHEIASTLGVPEQHGRALLHTIVDTLGGRRVLIVLDNCEHLIEQCAELVDVLVQACPQLHILATSRQSLRVDGEVNWRVPSLTLPDSRRPRNLAQTSCCEAVQLFADRATAAVSSFRLTEQNASAVAEVCLHLDGIPLAIELAAARIRVLSAEQIAARLGDVFRLLTAGSRTMLPRQQTLRATVDWSYELLDSSERQLFNRLSVFAGGWTLDACEAICAGGGVEAEVFDLLAHLVDKSLVLADERGGEVRYRFLEPVRQYAAEKLAGLYEENQVRARHLDWFTRFAMRADLQLRGPDLGLWLDRVETEYDNLRAATDWADAQQDGTEAELELCASLIWFWWARDRLVEGRERIERALRRPSPATVARMHALATAGWLAHFNRDQVTARSWIEESLLLARKFQDAYAAAWALHLLARTYYFEGDATTATSLGHESLAAARAIEDPWLEGWALHLLGLAAYVGGDYEQARAWYEESLEVRRPLGHLLTVLIVDQLLGYVAQRQGDFHESMAMQVRVLRFGRDLRIANSIGHGLVGLAALAVECDQPERAVRIAAAASRRNEAVGVLPIPIAEELLTECLARARNQLGSDAYAAAWEAGVDMSEEDAIVEALAIETVLQEQPSIAAPTKPIGDDGPSVPSKPLTQGQSLTRREIEVLRLVVDGRTTKEIASQLIISEPTVERHLTHIYTKVGARRRADATAFAVKHGLV